MQDGSRLANFTYFFVKDTAKIFYLTAMITFIMGVARTYIDLQKFGTLLSNKSKVFCYIIAAGLGVITPFCCCTGIPLFIALITSHVSLDIAMAFLITSPLVNEMAIVLLTSSISVKFAIVYVVASMFIGVCGGYVVSLCNKNQFLRQTDDNFFTQHQIFSKVNFIERVDFGLKEMYSTIKRIWLYVLIGTGLGAVLHGYIPQEWFIKYGNIQNYMAVPIVVILGMPLFANIAATVPIAQVLLDKGVPIGTVIAFVMSVVGVSFPQLVMLHKILRVRFLVFFVLFLLMMFTSMGYILNAFF